METRRASQKKLLVLIWVMMMMMLMMVAMVMVLLVRKLRSGSHVQAYLWLILIINKIVDHVPNHITYKWRL